MKRAVVKNEQMRSVLESAAQFQKLVPDAVMAGGSAVSVHIGHRLSFMLTFRNIDVSPDAPVEDWGFEGIRLLFIVRVVLPAGLPHDGEQQTKRKSGQHRQEQC